MTSLEFSQRLFQVEPGSAEAAALARDLVEDARFPASHVIQRYLPSPQDAEQMKAKNALADLGELALVPLAESGGMRNLDAELWVMRTLTEETVAFRRRAASVLKDLLPNRRPAPPVPEESAYQTPPGARVCDLSFILLHRLLHLEESSSAFLALPAADRDRRIREFQTSRPFRAAFESKV